MKRYFTVPEVAEHFSVHKQVVYKWISLGLLITWHPTGSVGSRGMRISTESLAKFEREGIIDPQDYLQ